jgi:hypothetical protein
MNSLPNPAEAPFAAEGGIDSPVEVTGDPYAALDELMAVVEAICPEWPQRETFRDGGKMLL